MNYCKTNVYPFTYNIVYLQEQYELRESLNRLNHQAIQSDPVNTSCLLLLETTRGKKHDKKHAVGKTLLHRKAITRKLWCFYEEFIRILYRPCVGV